MLARQILAATMRPPLAAMMMPMMMMMTTAKSARARMSFAFGGPETHGLKWLTQTWTKLSIKFLSFSRRSPWNRAAGQLKWILSRSGPTLRGTRDSANHRKYRNPCRRGEPRWHCWPVVFNEESAAARLLIKHEPN
jgi:hypothetical protein